MAAVFSFCKERTPRWVARVLSATVSLAMVPIAVVVSATAAGAAPFECLTPTVYIAQGEPTQLYTLTYSPGSASLTPIGDPAGPYNSIAFNPDDGFIYGVRNITAGAGEIIRIDDTGAITSTGLMLPPDNYNVGAFDSGIFYVMRSTTSTLYAIDLVNGTITPIALSAPQMAPDLTPIGGSLWGVGVDGRFVRVDPATGTVTTFSHNILPGVTAGAVWTFGNGNLRISDNNTGTIYQVEIADPDSATPTFTLISEASGPSTTNNDGTSCQVQSVNLGISKSGPATVAAGGQITWTLTVTNESQGVSSGYTVTDEVPASVTGVTTSTPGCTVTNNTVVCVGGVLQPGEDATITITGTAPPTSGTTVSNTATVLGNEDDDASDNDASTVTTTVTEDDPGVPTSKDQCKKGGWMNFGDKFRNQGDCVSFFVRQR